MFILVTTSRTIHVSKYHTPKKKEKGVPMVGGEFQKIKNSDYDYLYIDFLFIILNLKLNKSWQSNVHIY